VPRWFECSPYMIYRTDQTLCGIWLTPRRKRLGVTAQQLSRRLAPENMNRCRPYPSTPARISILCKTKGANLQAVLVRPRGKHNLAPIQPFPPRDAIRKHRCVHMTNMRCSVHVKYRRGDVKRLGVEGRGQQATMHPQRNQRIDTLPTPGSG
jgi:hypothetical protein